MQLHQHVFFHVSHSSRLFGVPTYNKIWKYYLIYKAKRIEIVDRYNAMRIIGQVNVTRQLFVHLYKNGRMIFKLDGVSKKVFQKSQTRITPNKYVGYE